MTTRASGSARWRKWGIGALVTTVAIEIGITFLLYVDAQTVISYEPMVCMMIMLLTLSCETPLMNRFTVARPSLAGPSHILPHLATHPLLPPNIATARYPTLTPPSDHSSPRNDNHTYSPPKICPRIKLTFIHTLPKLKFLVETGTLRGTVGEGRRRFEGSCREVGIKVWW